MYFGGKVEFDICAFEGTSFWLVESLSWILISFGIEFVKVNLFCKTVINIMLHFVHIGLVLNQS